MWTWVIGAVLSIAFLIAWFVVSGKDFFSMGLSIEMDGKNIVSLKCGEAPDHYRSNGLQHLDGYISRLFSSDPQNFLIVASANDGEVSMERRNGKTVIGFLIQASTSGDRERTIRDFFSARGMEVHEDFRDRTGLRTLSYWGPSDAEATSILTRDVLTKIFGVRKNDGLDYTLCQA